MFVVNTTSATVWGASETSEPRKRVPSSRRRHPGRRSVISLTALLLLASGWWRILRRRSCDRRRSRNRRWRATKSLIENGRRGTTARGHQLQDKGDAEEQAAGPPRDLGQYVAGLTSTDEGIGRGGNAAKRSSEPAALGGLHQHRRHQDESVNNQENQQERVHSTENPRESLRAKLPKLTDLRVESSSHYGGPGLWIEAGASNQQSFDFGRTQ